MQDDLAAINNLCRKLGGLSKTARALKVSPQQLHHWKQRRVSPQQRLNFLTVYNAAMPKTRQLDLSWLASPPANYGNGSKAHG